MTEQTWLREKRRHWVLMLICCGVSWLVMALLILVSLAFVDSSWIATLQQGNSSITKNIDYLQFVVPVLLTVGGFMVAFLGMNRLKDFDTHIADMKTEMRKELSDEKGLLRDLRDSQTQVLKSQVDAHTRSFEEEFLKTLNNDIERIRGENEEFLKTSLATIRDISDSVYERLAGFEEKYKWLISTKVDEDEFDLEIVSTYDAHKKIEAIYQADDKPRDYLQIVFKIVDLVCGKTVRGDQSDYHNLAAELGRQNLFDKACKVCEAGISFFPNDVDLLADWIKYATNIGDYDNAEKAIGSLNQIATRLWNWRAFDFVIDYYVAIANMKKAIELSDEFVKWLPNEERAYKQKADVKRKTYDPSTGEDVAESVIAILKKPLEMNLNCPMCANALADELSELGRLEEALNASNRAVQELAQDQPSVNHAFVFFRRALIQDRLFHQALLDEHETSNAEALLMGLSACKDYAIAIESRRLTPITLNQAKTRLELIAQHLHGGNQQNDDQ